MNRCFIKIHPGDNVAVALIDAEPGEVIEPGIRLRASEKIRGGHKVALAHVPTGAAVVKYRYPIGVASRDISPGEWVHVHNLKSALTEKNEFAYGASEGGTEKKDGYDFISQNIFRHAPNVRPDEKTHAEPLKFSGYRRADGRAGIRNEIWIVPTVGCVNAIGRRLEEVYRSKLPPGVDGVTAYTHPYGCSQLGDDHENTRRALRGLTLHPNAGGVLVLGLGCENNVLEDFKKFLGPFDPDRILFLQCQDHEDEIAAATPLMERLLVTASRDRREPCGISLLTVGLKCGGSDGYSGLTANPLTGAFTDKLTAAGGSAIMTEVPEMFGAEQILADRCVSREVFEKFAGMTDGFKKYFIEHGQPVNENPSPGNRDGGITTLEEKSLGCVQKGGSAAITDVLGYGEPSRIKGLNLLLSPGNDLVSSAALAVSGAQLVIFTTGRGTPFGCPVPTVKVSSNACLSRRKKNWIDFDAGRLVFENGAGLGGLADELFDYILRVASGAERAKSEALPKNEFAIFKNGVTL